MNHKRSYHRYHSIIKVRSRPPIQCREIIRFRAPQRDTTRCDATRESWQLEIEEHLASASPYFELVNYRSRSQVSLGTCHRIIQSKIPTRRRKGRWPDQPEACLLYNEAWFIVTLQSHFDMRHDSCCLLFTQCCCDTQNDISICRYPSTSSTITQHLHRPALKATLELGHMQAVSPMKTLACRLYHLEQAFVRLAQSPPLTPSILCLRPRIKTLL